MASSESFEEFLGEEVVDFDGNPIGTFACYWERIKGRPVLLGIDCDGDQRRTRVAPAKGAWLNVKQTHICLPYAKEYVEQAPCLDCDLERTPRSKSEFTTIMELSRHIRQAPTQQHSRS